MPLTQPTPEWNVVELRWHGKLLDGKPAQGRLIVTSDAPRFLDDTGDDAVSVFSVPLVVPIATDGSAVFYLPATDDPDITPTGSTYTIKEDLTQGAGESVTITVPLAFADVGIDLNRAVPVGPSTGSPVDAPTRAELDSVAGSAVLRNMTSVGVDEDGTPYYLLGQPFEKAQPVYLDSDGQPYVQVPSDGVPPIYGRGVPDGIAPLDSTGKVPADFIDMAAITTLLGSDASPTTLQADGDSLAVGTGDTGGTKQWATLATGLDLGYHNSGQSGQTTTEAAIRMGALDPVFTKTGNLIATGTAAQDVTLGTTGAWKALAYTWTGHLTNAAGETLDGTLAHDAAGTGWTFTRATAGTTAFDITGGATFHCTENDAYRDTFHLIVAGTNNLAAVVIDADLSIAVRDFDLMTRYCRNGYVIVGLHMQPSDAYVAAKTSFNTMMVNRFGNRWVDVNTYMQSYGLALAGITPTAQDFIDLGNGRVPTSLMSDNTHPNTAGYTVWRRAVEQQIRTRGYATAGKIPMAATTTASVVTVGAPTATTIPITWTAVTGAVGYRVEYRKTGAASWLQGPNATGTSATVQDPVSNDLANGTTYDIRVTPYNDAGPGTVSATVTGTTTGTAPVVITSDAASGGAAANLNGQSLDLAYGGSAATWATNNANTSRTAGGLIHMAGPSIATVDLGAADHRVTAKFVTLTTSSVQSLLARYTDTSNYYYVQVTSAGQVKLTKLVAGVSTLISVTPFGSVAYTAGQVIELRVVGTALKVIVGGTTVLSATDSALTTGNKAGLSASAACDFDDVVFYTK